ncbi:MAG: Ldh family oxidoreductase [Candidatus Poribacteria bacterium]|nr:Ldh family oxidoreductase [Candidatus Poribacteria bacterium]
MKYFSASQLQQISTKILDAAGSPHEESVIVSRALVRSNLMGHDSHGVLRIAQYVGDIRNGEILPGAPIEIEREMDASAVINGNSGWGMVIAQKAMQLAIDKARRCSIGTAVVRGSHHVGRVGEYPTMAAAAQMIGMAAINSYGTPGMMAPWGGIDRRLSPNPLAFAMPSGEKWPVLVDVTTSVVPEGKVRAAQYAGESLPEGCIIDSEGNPTTDPNAFYGPPTGAILPLGGVMGHKGYGLGIVATLLAGALSGVGCNGPEAPMKGNGIFFQAINIDAFLPLEEFIQTVQGQIDWMKSSRRRHGVDEILFPGEPEFRTAQRRETEGIPVEDSVWNEMVETAESLGLELAE